MPPKMASQQANYDPICPHCEKEIKVVHWRQLEAVNAEYVYTCSNCHKVIGIGVRKAAWIN